MIAEWGNLLLLGVFILLLRIGYSKITFKTSCIFYPILLLSLFQGKVSHRAGILHFWRLKPSYKVLKILKGDLPGRCDLAGGVMHKRNYLFCDEAFLN
jgi:hypothetical protein